MGAHCNTCSCAGQWVTMDELEAMAYKHGLDIETDQERNRCVVRWGNAEFSARMPGGAS